MNFDVTWLAGNWNRRKFTQSTKGCLAAGTLAFSLAVAGAQETPAAAPGAPKETPSAPAASQPAKSGSTNAIVVTGPQSGSVTNSTMTPASTNGNGSGFSSRNRGSRDSGRDSGRNSSGGSSNTTNAAPRGSFDSFRVVNERNIFDASRRPSARGGPVVAPPPVRRVESFTLTGTMSYEKGAFAFFDGSNTQYRKVAKPGDTIGGYALKEITATSAKLEQEGKEVELKVGMQMRREDDGPWSVSLRSSTSTGTGTSSGSGSGSTNTSSDTSTSAPEEGGGANDLLKRLMQQREKELNK